MRRGHHARGEPLYLCSSFTCCVCKPNNLKNHWSSFHKSLLRADFAASALEDFTQGGFQTIIEDDDAPQTTQKTILCSGKIYWDLQKERKASHPDAPIRILRLEQLYPFPAAELTKMLGTKTQDITWVQEEPANGGAYLFVKQMLEELNIKTHYVGARRPPVPPRVP